jgi:hypothetical protein
MSMEPVWMAESGLSACVVPNAGVERLGECLASLAFCDEIFVLACGPHAAQVRALAGKFGARVLPTAIASHSARRQAAVDAARHDWVLNLDASETVSDLLRDEIGFLRQINFAGFAAFAMPRCNHYFGRPIRHGGWYPDRRLRLFDRCQARWDERTDAERVISQGRIADLQGDIVHHAYRSLADQRVQLQHYAEWSARAMHAAGRRARLWNLLLDPAWRMFRGLILQRGLLDGWRGVAIAALEADCARQKQLGLWMLNRGHALSERDLVR